MLGGCATPSPKTEVGSTSVLCWEDVYPPYGRQEFGHPSKNLFRQKHHVQSTRFCKLPLSAPDLKPQLCIRSRRPE